MVSCRRQAVVGADLSNQKRLALGHHTLGDLAAHSNLGSLSGVRRAHDARHDAAVLVTDEPNQAALGGQLREGQIHDLLEHVVEVLADQQRFGGAAEQVEGSGTRPGGAALMSRELAS